MSDQEVILYGVVVGLVVVAIYKATQFDPNAGISAATGGVTLPAGQVYGPPAPAPTTDGTLLGGLV